VRTAPWPWIRILFLLGLLLRCPVFLRKNLEWDEIIYRALVEQLDSGKGYTLRGHRLLQEGLLDKAVYGQALFHHPPAGIGLFWLLRRLFGEAGFALAEVLGYAVFFWAMMLLAIEAGAPLLPAACLSAFTPIMTHAVSRFWLDAPMLALSTLACGLFLGGAARGRTSWVLGAAAALGAASLVKQAAFLLMPGLLALAWASAPEARRPRLVMQAALFACAALLIQAPWALSRWALCSSPFSGRAGLPTPSLTASSPYLGYLTYERPAWIYLKLLPAVLWTLVPSCVLFAARWRDETLRRKGSACLLWIAFIAAFLTALGLAGYSKLLRYAVLVTPASVLLFSLTAGSAWRLRRRPAGKALLALAAAGLILEVAQGMATPLIDDKDLIWPLFPGLMF
jgi:4-amino-4-deoxy-L-arabinose transferase-like glycosyltransferase